MKNRFIYLLIIVFVNNLITMSMNINDLLHTNGILSQKTNYLNKQIPPGEITHSEAQFSDGKDLFNQKILNRNYYEGLIREGKTTRYVVNFDTRFRKDLNQKSTDCLFVLPEKIVNIVAIRLATIEMPNIFYVFSEAQGNIKFQIIEGSNIYEIEIPEGNYQSSVLISTIQSLLPANYTITINPYDKKTEITNTLSTSFDLKFDIGNNCNQGTDWGLGYYLGFREKTYTGLSSYTSEAVLNVIGYDYLFLEFNDFNLNDKQMVISYLNNSLLSTKLLGKIILRDNKYTIAFDDGRDLLTRARVYNAPVNIERVHIRILDPFGRTVDLLQNNFSFTIEFLTI